MSVAEFDIWEMEDLLDLLSEGPAIAQDQRRRRAYTHEDGSIVHRQGVGESLRAHGPAPSLRAFHIATIHLAAAEDFMFGMNASLLAYTSVAPFALARASLESLGRAFTMLDPDLTAEQRAAAAITSELYSLHSALRLERKNPSEPGSDASLAAEEIRSQMRLLKREAAHLGLRVIPAKKNSPPAVGKARPMFTDVLDQLLPIGSEPHGHGETLASSYSAFAHSDPEMLLTLVQAGGVRVTSISQIDALSLDASLTLSVIWPVVISHLKTVQRYIGAYGWGRSRWARYRRHALHILDRHARRLGHLHPEGETRS